MSPKTAKTATTTTKKFESFSAEERAAAKARVQEMKGDKANGESAAVQAIGALPPTERAMAKRLHALIKSSVPSLSAKTWYGMPAYANKDGKIVCHFQPAQKFKTRYATFGFSDQAKLDDGNIWPVAYALKELTDADEARIAALLRKAVS